jgi:hypothetical protein
MTNAAHLLVPTPWSALLEAQDQVISRTQARLGGLSEDQWQWRLTSGRWQSVLKGVAVAHSGEVTDSQRAWAAVLFAGPTAHLSADAALIQHGMRLPAPTVLHVVTDPSLEVTAQLFARADPSAQRFRLEPHRLVGLADWTHPVKTPPVLFVAPAVLHAAAWAASDKEAEWRIAAAVQQRLTRVSDLRAALAQMPRLRRRRLILAVLDDVEFGAHAASELQFLRFLRVTGLPMPDRLQRPVRRGTLRYLDAWWERQRVTVEVDVAHHLQVGQWDADTLRANDVVIAEKHDRVLLLRLTTSNLRHEGPRVAEQLRSALR